MIFCVWPDSATKQQFVPLHTVKTKEGKSCVQLENALFLSLPSLLSPHSNARVPNDPAIPSSLKTTLYLNFIFKKMRSKNIFIHSSQRAVY
jgi:hypothetical protein